MNNSKASYSVPTVVIASNDKDKKVAKELELKINTVSCDPPCQSMM